MTWLITWIWAFSHGKQLAVVPDVCGSCLQRHTCLSNVRACSEQQGGALSLVSLHCKGRLNGSPAR